MAQVFIAYTEADAPTVRELVDYLRNREVEYWVDMEHVGPQDDWMTAVHNGLQASDLMLLVLSPASQAAAEVEEQWRFCLSAGKPIIPFMISEVHNLHFRLASLNIVDVQRHGFSNACALLEREIHMTLRDLNSPDPNRTVLERPMLNLEPKKTTMLRPVDMDLDMDHATTRIDDNLVKDLTDREHFYNEQMVLEFTSYKDRDLHVELEVVPGRVYLIGRSSPDFEPDVDLNVLGAEGQGISRRHAMLTLDNDTIFIRDNNSTNFTFIEGRKLSPEEEAPLRSGDRVQMGNFLFLIRYRPL